MEKMLYDADSCPDKLTGTCLKFVMDEQTSTVSLIDKQGNKVNISIDHFNKFIRAVKSGEIEEIKRRAR